MGEYVCIGGSLPTASCNEVDLLGTMAPSPDGNNVDPPARTNARAAG